MFCLYKTRFKCRDNCKIKVEKREKIYHASINQKLELISGCINIRGTRDQIANIRRIMEKAREFQKNIYFCFIDYAYLKGLP